MITLCRLLTGLVLHLALATLMGFGLVMVAGVWMSILQEVLQ